MECGERGTGGMLTRIPGNLLDDSGEFSRRFRGMFQKIPVMFKKIPGNVREDLGECYQRFHGMFKKILGIN